MHGIRFYVWQRLLMVEPFYITFQSTFFFLVKHFCADISQLWYADLSYTLLVITSFSFRRCSLWMTVGRSSTSSWLPSASALLSPILNFQIVIVFVLCVAFWYGVM